MIKHIINGLLLVLSLSVTSSKAQTISPSVITPQGNNYIAAGTQLSFTTGGLINTSFSNGGYILTQGFEQPELQVWTGSIGLSGICPGSILNLPFIQSGIISNSNNFIAELSNASGSFASPVTVGSLTGNVNGTISCTIPLNTISGTGYRIRVRSSLPAFTGPDNGNDFSVWIKPTCSITAIPSNNIYTGGVPTNIYLGYGPQQVTLSTAAAGGGPFTYSWTGNGILNCTNCAAPVFAPTSGGVYNFTVTVTNFNGCTTTCTITICVLDIRVPGTNGKKVYICHAPPGNPTNTSTQEVNVNSVGSHIPGHPADKLGKCGEDPCSPPLPISRIKNNVEENTGELMISAMPNPARDHFNLLIKSPDTELVTVQIVDVYGRILFTRSGVTPNGTMPLGEKLFSGIYFVNVIQGKRMETVRVVKIN